MKTGSVIYLKYEPNLLEIECTMAIFAFTLFLIMTAEMKVLLGWLDNLFSLTHLNLVSNDPVI